MQIVCPACSTNYQLTPAAIGASGRTVRCVRCQHVWFVPAPGVMPAVAAAEPFAPSAPPEPESPPPHAVDETPPPEPAAEPAATDATEPPPIHDAFDAPTAPETHEERDEQRPVALSDIPIPVTDAPPLAPEPGDGIAAEAGTIDNDARDIEHAAERRRARAAARRKSKRLRIPLPVLIVLLLLLCGALLGLRKDIVRHVPQMASFYAAIGMPVNLRGLVFHDVKISNETHDGVPVLVVEGVIASTVSVPVDVPRIRFALRNAAGAEVYSWVAQPSQPVVEPGEAVPFRSRLASPPADGQNLQVRFLTRHDAASGAR
jgi:predicted Zn finger-like uncharacterized protein